MPVQMKAMAEAVKRGLEIAEVKVTMYRIPEGVDEKSLAMEGGLKSDDPVLTTAHYSALENADGVVFGVPSRHGLPPASAVELFDSLSKLCNSGTPNVHDSFSEVFFATPFPYRSLSFRLCLILALGFCASSSKVGQLWLDPKISWTRDRKQKRWNTCAGCENVLAMVECCLLHILKPSLSLSVSLHKQENWSANQRHYLHPLQPKVEGRRQRSGQLSHSFPPSA